ncbi:hypothetical protein M1N90_00290 [Dehalococcoidia bacterium]|nr:hypothetical protein [Dehalococcoidia bacterium]
MSNFFSNILDIIPPYQVTEGLLENKEEGDGDFFIHVSSKKIRVDEHTFTLLMIGENIKVMATRSRRAITIERLLPTQGPV